MQIEMSLSTKSERKYSLKKLSGKANTLNSRAIYDESIATTVDVHASHIFSDAITGAPSNPTLYQINGPCEYVRFELEYIAGAGSPSYWTTNGDVLDLTSRDVSDPSPEYKALPSSFDGRHAFALKLPSDYQDNSANPNKADSKFANGSVLHSSGFQLQVVGAKFGSGYEPKLFRGTGVGITQIPNNDDRDWIFDSVAGIVFQQDPPGPGDYATNPTYLEGWLYIGNYLDESINLLSGSIATDIDLIQIDIADLQSGGSQGTTVPEKDFATKKLLGKSHTSPNKRHFNEAIPSFIYSNAASIPSSAPPIIGATSRNYYDIVDSKVEYLRLSGSYVDSGQSSDGRHGVKLHLPNDYQINSSNAKVGTGYWFNGRAINGTSGSIQLVPPHFNDNDSNYEAKPYYYDSDTASYILIPPEDERNWHLDYQSGILYQDTPADSDNLDPVVVDAWVWIGGVVSEGVGSGGGVASGTIGNAEDGTYTDGLFTDFNSSTPVGTAIDRFNEVLKALAPSPAPSVRSIDYTVSGGSVYSGKLSFDPSHPDPNGNFTAVTSYQQQGQNGFPVIGVNEVYQQDSITSPGNNYDESDLYFSRVGILSGIQSLTGEVNFNVPQLTAATGVVQYTEDCFGDGDIGNLILEVNGTQVHTLNLASFTGSGTAPSGAPSSTDLNVNGSGFTHISELRSGYTEGGSEFAAFKHRSANYIIAPNEMRKGFNTARVVHSKGGASFVTNYIEWVVDDTTDIISFSGSSIAPSSLIGSTYISGVRYHDEAQLAYNTTISNAYKAVYSTDPITGTTDSGTLPDFSIPALGPGEDMSKQIAYSNTLTVLATVDQHLGTAVNASITVPHPIKGTSTGANVQSNRLLLYSPTASATDTSEDFTLESRRLIDDTYSGVQPIGQASGFYDSSKIWNSQLHMSGSNLGHQSGLQIFNGQLVSPINSINLTRKGDFRNIVDGGSLETYADNPDYSVQAGNITGTRTYFRYFRNTTNYAQRDLRILYNGNTNLVAAGSSFDASRIKVSIKLPTTDSGDATGWMDVNSPYSMFLHGDGDGASIGSLDTTVTNLTTNYVTFGQREVQPDEVVIVRIEADTSWTGNLTSLEVQWGASSAGNTAPGTLAVTAQNLQDVSINDTGVSGKLSFGSSNPVSGFEDVPGIDFNENYTVTGYQRGIFSSVTADGILNDTQNDRFDDAHLGTLQLELNGSLIPESLIDLTNLTASGDFLNADGTGITNLSIATASVYSGTSLPSYNNIYRTAGVIINPASQRQGYNEYRVIHTIGAEVRTTNVCKWVIDGSSAQYDITGAEMDDWSDSNISYQSGIGYFQSPSSQVRYRANGVYTNVYSNQSDGVGWTSLTRVDLTSQDIVGAGIENKTSVSSDTTTLPNLLVGGESLPIDVTGSINWSGSNRVMPGTYGINASENGSIVGRVRHPLKNYASSSTLSKSNFLIATFSNSSSANAYETFDTEDYRLPDGTYANAAAISSASWDSTISVVGGTSGYDNGLVQYNGVLIAPSKAGVNGNFTTVPDGGIYQGPAGNPDYSGVAGQIAERVYLRSFHNTTQSDYANIDITLPGIGILGSNGSVNPTGALGANSNFKMFVKLVEPSGNSNSTTGWLDCGEEWTGGNQDNDGCSKEGQGTALAVNIASDSTVSISLPTGRFLYGTLSDQSRNYLIIKIVAHKEWTGRLTSLGVSF